MQVLMIRHSFAAEPGSVPGGDFERPLTDRGRRVFSKMAAWLVERGIVPDRIFYSPLVRARQTAALFAEACWAAPVRRRRPALDRFGNAARGTAQGTPLDRGGDRRRHRPRTPHELVHRRDGRGRKVQVPTGHDRRRPLRRPHRRSPRRPRMDAQPESVPRLRRAASVS